MTTDPVAEAVAAIHDAPDDETARALEAALLEDSDNGPKATDPNETW